MDERKVFKVRLTLIFTVLGASASIPARAFCPICMYLYGTAQKGRHNHSSPKESVRLYLGSWLFQSPLSVWPPHTGLTFYRLSFPQLVGSIQKTKWRMLRKTSKVNLWPLHTRSHEPTGMCTHTYVHTCTHTQEHAQAHMYQKKK